MSVHSFERLSPFIQEYIYKYRWDELREIQIAACNIIFDTKHHLLLASGTASGKTEAAFLPVLTVLQHNPAKSIGVLYIGPLKALINDQFHRLSHLLQEASIPVWHWHGDVSYSHKQKLIQQPEGVLQTTPESLESLLVNHHQDLPRMFGDLRYIIIDEIHVFMGTDRGSQVLCLLERLERCCGTAPRRIGLSATLGDYTIAKAWLRGNTQPVVEAPPVSLGGQRIRLRLEHFVNPADHEVEYTDYLFRHSQLAQGKCLIFSNNRAETESVIAKLRRVAQERKTGDIYYVHHGSVAATLRKEAERAMADPDKAAVIAATVTLELGIDIGRLERIIQLESPFSVASFLQRLGRSGRRHNASEMQIVTTEATDDNQWIADSFPWQLLQAIAIIQLYLEERWIEPPSENYYPVSLLYHQTMSTLLANSGLTPAQLGRRVLTLAPFRQITQADYRQFLRHLLELDHIELMEDGSLAIGLTADPIVHTYRFYAVFQEQTEYIVREGTTEVGSILTLPLPGVCFVLAGRAWEVLEIDDSRRIVFVKSVEYGGNLVWSGGASSVHIRIMQKVWEILLANDDYPYLQKRAQERLKQARAIAQDLSLATERIVPINDNQFCLFPWFGTKEFRTLERFFRICCREQLDIKSMSVKNPYYLVLQFGCDGRHAMKEAMHLLQGLRSGSQLLAREEIPRTSKFDAFVHQDLVRKAYVLDYLALDTVKSAVKSWTHPS